MIVLLFSKWCAAEIPSSVNADTLCRPPSMDKFLMKAWQACSYLKTKQLKQLSPTGLSCKPVFHPNFLRSPGSSSLHCKFGHPGVQCCLGRPVWIPPTSLENKRPSSSYGMAPNVAISWPFACIPMLGYLFWNRRHVKVSGLLFCLRYVWHASWCRTGKKGHKTHRRQPNFSQSLGQIFAALLAKEAVGPAWLVLIEATPAPTATTSVKSWTFWICQCCASSTVDEAAAAAPCWALLLQQLAAAGTKPGKYPHSRNLSTLWKQNGAAILATSVPFMTEQLARQARTLTSCKERTRNAHLGLAHKNRKGNSRFEVLDDGSH